MHKKEQLQLALEMGELQLDDEHWMMRDARASLVTVSLNLHQNHQAVTIMPVI